MTKTYPVLCAWCGVTIGQSSMPNSHGICESCTSIYKGVPSLSEQQLAALPFGVIELDSDGVILTYNKAEEALSGKDSAEVIGKNFFRDVAPCAAVKRFQGRLAEFQDSQSEPINFNFTFRFQARTAEVNITFLKSEHASVYVLVKSISEFTPTA